MEWKNAETNPPPVGVKILVKAPLYIGNDYSPYPGKVFVAGTFRMVERFDFELIKDNLYQRAKKAGIFFDEVEFDRDTINDGIFEWTEFSE